MHSNWVSNTDTVTNILTTYKLQDHWRYYLSNATLFKNLCSILMTIIFLLIFILAYDRIVFCEIQDIKHEIFIFYQ